MAADGPSTTHKRRTVLSLTFLLLAGLIIRLPLLPLFGTTDHYIWKVWSYAGATQPFGYVYRMELDRRPPLTWNNIQKVFDGRLAPARWAYSDQRNSIDYPPLVPLILGVVGRIYMTISPEYADTPLLNAILKVPALLADLGATCLIYFAVFRRGTPKLALLAAGAYWLNPMSILGGTLLAYQDPIYTAALVAAVILFSEKRHAWGWVLFVAALLTKPQPMLAAPVLLAASAAQRRVLKLTGYVVAASASAFSIMLPFVLGGTVLNVLAGMLQLVKQPFLSGNNCNIWWLAGYLLQVKQSLAGGASLPSSLGVQANIASIPALIAAGQPDPKPWGVGFMLVFTLVVVWAWWRRVGNSYEARTGGSPLLTEAVALQIYGGTMLLTQSHENHAYGAAAVLGVAWWLDSRSGIWDRELLALYCGLSAIVTLNLVIFYGLGGDPPTIPFPRSAILIDASVLLSVVNYIFFGWWLWRWIRGAMPLLKKPLVPTLSANSTS